MRNWTLGAVVALALAASACGGPLVQASDLALAKFTQTGGDQQLSLVGQSKRVREEVEDAVTGGPVAVVVDETGSRPLIRSVVGGCFPGTKYRYRGTRPTKERHEAKNESRDEFSAPLTAGTIGTDEKASSTSRISVVSVGRYRAESSEVKNRSRSEPCDAATHVLLEVEVGAWELEEGIGSAEIGRLSGGVGVTSGSDRLTGTTLGEGRFETCDNAYRGDPGPPADCAVPIRARFGVLQRSNNEAPVDDSPTAHEASPSEQATPSGAETIQVDRFEGRYRCGETTWTVLLELRRKAKGELTGGIDVSDGDVRESWGLVGTFYEDGRIDLQPTDSKHLASGYKPIGFYGAISSEGSGIMRGRVVSEGCSRFEFIPRR